MPVVVLLLAAVATVLPALGTYFLVPWRRIAEMGSAEVSERTVRGTRLGVSAAMGGLGTFVVAAPALLLGGFSTVVGVAALLLGTLLAVAGLLVPSALLVAEML
jgi:hypothetical protein